MEFCQRKKRREKKHAHKILYLVFNPASGDTSWLCFGSANLDDVYGKSVVSSGLLWMCAGDGVVLSGKAVCVAGTPRDLAIVLADYDIEFYDQPPGTDYFVPDKNPKIYAGEPLLWCGKWIAALRGDFLVPLLFGSAIQSEVSVSFRT